MKLKLLAAVCAFAIGSAASAQITETVTPLVLSLIHISEPTRRS